MHFILDMFRTISTSYFSAFVLLAVMVFAQIYSAQLPALGPWLMAVLLCQLLLGFFTHTSKHVFLQILVFLPLLVLKTDLPEFSKLYGFITVFVPVNFMVLVLLQESEFKSSKSFYLLAVLAAEAFLIEQFSASTFQLPADIHTIALCSCVLCALVLLIFISNNAGIQNSGTFYAFLCLSLGLFNIAKNPYAAFYFLAAMLILLGTFLYEHISAYFTDPVTQALSKNSYKKDFSKKDLLKYSLAVFCLDDYAKLVKIFNQKITNRILQMLIEKVRTLEPEVPLYRYSADEFILIFYTTSATECYEHMEALRRLIAGTEFVIEKNHPVKITISAGVSEKKRSDANADAVLLRTRETLRKTYKFTQNMTSKA